MALLRDRLSTPAGDLLTWSRGGAVVALCFADGGPAMAARLARRLPGARFTDGAGPARPALTAYLSGDLRALDAIAIDPGGTDFQRLVWGALRSIPPGETRAYGALAAALGRPTAARAVAAANGRNPVALVVPCHRVIGADGGLTGYAWGLERKRWLLAHEGAWPPGRGSRRDREAPAEAAPGVSS